VKEGAMRVEIWISRGAWWEQACNGYSGWARRTLREQERRAASMGAAYLVLRP
jgi:hypothetical protein